MFNVKEDGGNGWMQGIEERGEGEHDYGQSSRPIWKVKSAVNGEKEPGDRTIFNFLCLF